MRLRLYICTVLAVCQLVRSEVIYNSRNPLILAATNQCSSNDRQLWQNSTQSSQKFFQSIQTCTVEGGGATDLSQNVTSCLQSQNPGLSQNCAQCFGDDVDCGASNCRQPCQDPNSQNCTVCLNPCTQRLVSCTGTNTLPGPNGTTNANSFSPGRVVWLVGVLVGLSHMM